MKAVLLGIVVVVLMAASGGAGYYFGNASGLQSATNVQREFFATRAGAGTDTTTAQGAQRGAGQGNTAQAAGTRANPGGQTALGGAFGNLISGRPTANGSVKSVQGNTVTVTQADGTATTVTVDDKTTIEKFVSGTVADIQPGMTILVTEQNNLRRVLLLPAQ